MAQVSRTASKAKFETGDVPTQSDFGDLHDSVTWYDEGAGVSDGDKGDIVVSGSGSVWTLKDAFKQTNNLNIYSALGGSIIAEPPYGFHDVTSNASLQNQQLTYVPVWLNKPATITGVKWMQGSQGAYTASNYNGVGLYSYSAGTMTLQASSTNDGSIWKAASFGFASKAFSSTFSAVAGLYLIAFLYSNSAQTTAPTIAVANQGTTNSGIMDFTNNAKLFGFISSQTSLPTTQDMFFINSSITRYYLALY